MSESKFVSQLSETEKILKSDDRVLFYCEMSESKFVSQLSETERNSKIGRQSFVLLLNKRRTFFGTPGTSIFIMVGTFSLHDYDV